MQRSVAIIESPDEPVGPGKRTGGLSHAVNRGDACSEGLVHTANDLAPPEAADFSLRLFWFSVGNCLLELPETRVWKPKAASLGKAGFR